jgi:hypothetical protein
LAHKFHKIDNHLNVQNAGYKSSLDGLEKKGDELANKLLSDWNFNEIFEKNLKNAWKLEWHHT